VVIEVGGRSSADPRNLRTAPAGCWARSRAQTRSRSTRPTPGEARRCWRDWPAATRHVQPGAIAPTSCQCT